MILRIALAAFVVAGCWRGPTGISREQAIDLALHEGSDLEQPIVVLGAREGRLAELRNDPSGQIGPIEDQDRLVWEVILQGRISICKPAGGSCVVAMGTSKVYLDHATGMYLSSETSANPPPFPN